MISQKELLTINKSELERQNLVSITTKTTLPEKEPSLLGISILIILTIALYAFGINESGEIVTGIVETVAKEAVGDYPF